MDRMSVEINSFMSMDKKTKLYCANISVDGEFFKQVGGVSNPISLFGCIEDSLQNDEDFQKMI